MKYLQVTPQTGLINWLWNELRIKWLSHLTKSGLDYCNSPNHLITQMLYRILTPVDNSQFILIVTCVTVI